MSQFSDQFAVAARMLAEQFGTPGVIEIIPRDGQPIRRDAILYPKETTTLVKGLERRQAVVREVKLCGICAELKLNARIAIGEELYRVEMTTADDAFTSATLEYQNLRQIINPDYHAPK